MIRFGSLLLSILINILHLKNGLVIVKQKKMIKFPEVLSFKIVRERYKLHRNYKFSSDCFSSSYFLITIF